MKSVVREAIEIAGLYASNLSFVVHDLRDNFELANLLWSAYWEVWHTCGAEYTPAERWAEVAQLLREGWRLGQPLVKR